MTPEQPREIEYEGDSVRITLRAPTGLAAVLEATQWLRPVIVWVLLFVILLGYFGLFGEGFGGFGSGFFIVVAMFLLWTLIVVWNLRTRIGSDVIELTPGGWSATRRIGPFHKTRAFDPAAEWAVTVATGVLAATRGRKIIVISTLGDVSEWIWIRDAIRMRFSPTTPRGLPAGYSSRAAETGGLIISGDFGRLRAKTFLHVAPNFVEHRLGLFGLTTTSRITDAKLRLYFADADENYHLRPMFFLETHEHGGRRVIVAMSSRVVGDTLALGELLARETGWPLEVDPAASV